MLDAPSLARVLFAEDFDDVSGVIVIEAPREQEPVAHLFTVGDLELARERAHEEGRAAGRAEADAARADETSAALADIAAALQGAASERAVLARRDAEEVARLLLDTLMTFLPALCARHGEAEVRAVARAVLPALLREPAVTVRVGSGFVPAIRGEIDRLDPDLAARVRLVETEAMAPGDMRVSWADGTAVRDTGAVWAEVAEVLSEAGLLLQPDEREGNARGR